MIARRIFMRLSVSSSPNSWDFSTIFCNFSVTLSPFSVTFSVTLPSFSITFSVTLGTEIFKMKSSVWNERGAALTLQYQ